MPFAALLSNRDRLSFCGKAIEENSIIQASGGDWDVNFKDTLNVVAAVFERVTFNRDIQLLTGEEIPKNWLVSKACLTDPLALTQYAMGLNNIIKMVQNKPEILMTVNALRMMNDTILRLVFNALDANHPLSCETC